jgi:hypothetical protein
MVGVGNVSACVYNIAYRRRMRFEVRGERIFANVDALEPTTTNTRKPSAHGPRGYELDFFCCVQKTKL